MVRLLLERQNFVMTTILDDLEGKKAELESAAEGDDSGRTTADAVKSPNTADFWGSHLDDNRPLL